MSSLTQGVCENVPQTFEVDAGRRSADDDVWNVSQASKVKIRPFFAGTVAFPVPKVSSWPRIMNCLDKPRGKSSQVGTVYCSKVCCRPGSAPPWGHC